MTNLKKINVANLKKWLKDNYGKDIFKILKVYKSKKLVDSYFIKTNNLVKPKNLIIGVYPNGPYGKYCVWGITCGTRHHVSTLRMCSLKLKHEVNALLVMLDKITKSTDKQSNHMDFKHLLKTMSKLGCKFFSRTNSKKNDYLRGGFDKPNKYRYRDSNLNMPVIFYDLDKKKISGYTDGSNKCTKEYKILSKYIDEYYIYETGSGRKSNDITVINDDTIHNVFKQLINNYKKSKSKNK